ncbi:hypothetical protein GCM10010129_74870 [Streptomyces fumigatiscleroticus]|nr:hypothetical protein GCM10010129_74870 [Streptomyces fumigatiscleroticus]
MIEIGLTVVDLRARERVARHRIPVRPTRSGRAGATTTRLAGLPLEGRHHRGEDDAWNIAALVLDLVERGA